MFCSISLHLAFYSHLLISANFPFMSVYGEKKMFRNTHICMLDNKFKICELYLNFCFFS